MPNIHVTRRSELLARCIPMLRDQVRRQVDDAEAAQEVLQDVILTILSAPACPDDMPRFAAHARDVAREAAFKDRSAGPTDALELPWDDDLPEALDPLVDPEQAVDTREALSRLVDPLGSEALELLVRRYVLGENANELARRLAQTPAALRVRLMRLRTAARGHFPGHG